MKIGKFQLKLGAPDPARLFALASCTVPEMRALLAGPCIAGSVASAILACATGEKLPDRLELSREIEAVGVRKVRQRVLVAYYGSSGEADRSEGSDGKA